MIKFLLVGTGSGILFALLDGLINGNPIARNLYKVYEPIARKTLSIPAGIAIDLVYGFAMAGVFLLLRKALPGESWILKGISFGLMAWFFRVAMQAGSQWMMFEIPAGTLLYTSVCGLAEMLILGLLYGLTLKAPV